MVNTLTNAKWRSEEKWEKYNESQRNFSHSGANNVYKIYFQYLSHSCLDIYIFFFSLFPLLERMKDLPSRQNLDTTALRLCNF